MISNKMQLNEVLVKQETRQKKILQRYDVAATGKMSGTCLL